MFSTLDPVRIAMLVGYTVLCVWLLAHWYFFNRHHFDEDVIENNIRRLITKNNLHVTLEDTRRVIALINEVAELRELLEDQDLNHYEIRKNIRNKLQKCVDVYLRVGVPAKRLYYPV